MSTVDRIPSEEARKKVEMGGAILVCAYENPETFQANQLEGAISLQEFRSHGSSMQWDQEIIFYDAEKYEEEAVKIAAATMALGLSNSKVLLGGVQAWKGAGFPLVSST